MPAKPDLSLKATDPAFDAYRSRVAELYRDDRQVGLAYVRIEAWSEAVAGRWWWTKWSEPVEVPHVFFLVDGDRSDTVGGPEGNDEWLAEWDRGCFDYYGEALTARWLSIEESERQERSAFAVAGTARRG